MKKISIIDDSEVNCILAKSLLCEQYIVNYYLDSTTALNYLKNVKPDMILLDIMMPEKDGLSLLKDIRNDDAFEGTIIIMVSSLTDDDRIDEAIKLGANDYLSKPIGNNDLLGLVNSYLL